jgi:ribosomal-protein-alanine N-acetyltransferase
MKLWPLQRDSTVPDLPFPLPEVVLPVLATYRGMYETTPYVPPWIGYLASEEDRLVGTCAFKGAPKDGRAEIAYFTFPEYEGKGVATRMARQLVEIATAADPGVLVTAQTLPAHSASTSILQKLGFVLHRSLIHPEDGLVWEWHRVVPKPA